MRSIGFPELLIIFTVLIILPGIALVLLFSVLRGRQKRALQQSVLDRVSSGPDLAAFLQSASGERFIQSLSDGMANPASSILACLHRGILILLLGAGFLVIGKIEPWGDAPVAFGILLVFLGLGFLLSAGISYRISKAWRLLDRAPTHADH
jgi:hypothetical protein